MSCLRNHKRAADRHAVLVVAAALVLATPGGPAAGQGLRKDHVQRMSKLSGLPASAVVSVRQGLAVAIRDRGVRSAAGVVEGVRLHGEVVDPQAVADLGFASMTSRVDVDCVRRRDRVVAMEVFAEPGLKGYPERRAAPGGWIQPSPQAYLADVLRAVCGGRRDPGVQVAALDQADAPISTAIPKRPPLRPAVGPERPPAPAAPTRAPAEPAAPPPKPESARGARTATVQVGALDTRGAAEDAARKAARGAPAGVVARVEAATVDGRDYYRALVGGFGDRADASRFCKAFMAAGGACFVR